MIKTENLQLQGSGWLEGIRLKAEGLAETTICDGALVLAPLSKGLFEPDTVLFYGNPAQIMRLAQGVVHATGRRIVGNFGGKVECTEYLIAPFQAGSARIAIPGLGDRIFSMTQDDELVLSIPGGMLPGLYDSLKTVGKKIGARYPVPSYLNYQPEFPEIYQELGARLELLVME